MKHIYYWHRSLSSFNGVCSVVSCTSLHGVLVRFENGKELYVSDGDLQHICQSCHMPSCDCP
jgi:hypothetical protein